MIIRRVCAALAFASLVAASPLAARELTIAYANRVTAVDPHFHYSAANIAMSRHFFDPLILQDEEQGLRPGLALSWTALDDRTWELRLRPGVRFHDGSEFTAEDVAFTLERAANVPNSPGSFAIYIRAIDRAVVIDRHTIRLHTVQPHPQLPWDLSTFGIIPRSIAAFATTAEFASGRAMVGTGPFRFESWTPNEKVVMVRNDDYWGERPAWSRVAVTLVPNNTARLAALLSGTVDVIEQVPSVDVAQLRQRGDVALAGRMTNRVTYLNMDADREVSPFVTDRAGNAPVRNPLRDARVRRALSMAINRAALVEHTLSGAGVPIGQMVPKGLFGHDPALAPHPYDPDAAQRLLAEAGYADGFGVTLHGATDAFENGPQVCQAVAQMLARIGIATRVETMPRAVYTPRASAQTYSFMIHAWASESGESSGPLKALLATYDREKGWGTSNRGRYSNPRFDQALETALKTLDIGARELLLRQAMRIAMDDAGAIPLYAYKAHWGLRAGLTYAARADSYTLAQHVRPAAR